MAKCENVYCRKYVDRLFPIISTSKRWDLCLNCYETFLSLMNTMFEMPKSRHVDPVHQSIEG